MSIILRLSREYGGEHYVKPFDVWTHLVVMLYAVIMRFDSLREIMASLQAESRKLVSLLTNGMESVPDEIIEIYRKRWEIELLFKQIKQNFPLKYFYEESANAIKIQI